MTRQPYASPADFVRAQDALMRWALESGLKYHLHKGDVGHRIYNNCHGYDPAEIFHTWLDAHGDVAAFAMLSPHKQFLDLQVAPHLLFGDLHSQALDFCERESVRIAKNRGLKMTEICMEVTESDPAHVAFAAAHGFGNGQLSIINTRHDLSNLPDAPLPHGFRFHDATSADSAQLADVHNHSFANKWTAESYREVITAPHMECESVVVAPDGRFAAFVNLWHDSLNRSMLFEPVGTHSDFRRMGIAKALMAQSLRRMQREWRINHAWVGHAPADKNPASAALYASVGFVKVHEYYDYCKAV